MRYQQINLYQPVFKKKQVTFSFNSLLSVVILAVLVLGVLTGYMWHKNGQLEATADSLVGTISEMDGQLASLREKVGKPKVNRMLEAELNRLKAKSRDGYQLLNTLSQSHVGSKVGFSDYFVGLARQAENGLWLTNIRIGSAGQSMILKGNTLTPQLVPSLLQKLKHEEVFQGQSFQVVEVTQTPEEEGESLAFTLQTTLDTKEGEQ